ncbi:MAG: MarR family transcriptional regulator [Bacillota bacterium]
MNKEMLIRELDRLISTIGKHFTNARKGFRDHDVSGPQFFLLRHIAIEGPRNVSQVAEQFNLNQATVSNIVHFLHDKGLILRKSSPDDRRITLLEVTEAGRAIVEEIETERFEKFKQILEHLPPEDLAELVRIFSRLKTILEY